MSIPHWSVGHLNCFLFGAVTDDVITNFQVWVTVDVFSILLGINLGIEFLSHPKQLNTGFKVSICSNLFRTSVYVFVCKAVLDWLSLGQCTHHGLSQWLRNTKSIQVKVQHLIIHHLTKYSLPWIGLLCSYFSVSVLTVCMSFGFFQWIFMGEKV